MTEDKIECPCDSCEADSDQFCDCILAVHDRKLARVSLTNIGCPHIDAVMRYVNRPEQNTMERDSQ